MVKELLVKSYNKLDSIKFLPIPIFKYKDSISQEVAKGNLSREKCFELLEQLFMIRTLEDMLVQISAGNYKPLPGFNYIGPTHLSIGQEAISVGAISAVCPTFLCEHRNKILSICLFDLVVKDSYTNQRYLNIRTLIGFLSIVSERYI